LHPTAEVDEEENDLFLRQEPLPLPPSVLLADNPTTELNEEEKDLLLCQEPLPLPPSVLLSDNPETLPFTVDLVRPVLSLLNTMTDRGSSSMLSTTIVRSAENSEKSALWQYCA
jgi:ABC-type ATPase involved in cell division